MQHQTPATPGTDENPQPQPDTPTPSDGASPTGTPSGFAALGLRPELLKALTILGYEEPTPIQREAIPPLLEGRDLLGQAATGTGKTAAFALPALQKIDPGAPVEPTILVIVPTRELAVQVSEAMFRYGREMRVRVVPVFGGQPIQRQLRSLDRGAHVVVATPGRAIDHIKRGSLQLDSVRTVVLDEADEMLDMGFTEDIEAILENTPPERQTVLFSATMPSRITAIARRYQNDPVKIRIGAAEASDDGARVRQSVYMVSRHHKASALGRILDIESPGAALVFCRTRVEVDSLTETMNARGYRAEALHGGMDQRQRDRVMGRLRDGTAELLVATDVAARGLDVDTLTHVVNYDVPAAPESYVHRIGRVGRAGRSGVAITLAEPRERRLLRNIERLTRQKITVEKIPSVADLRARQMDKTVQAIREALAADDIDAYNPVLHALAGDDNLRNVALAAVKLLHEAGRGEIDETEIPDATERGRSDRGRRDRGNRSPRPKGRDRGRSDGPRGRGTGRAGSPTSRGRSPSGRAGTGYLYVSLGRKGGVRPADLVGAVANESGLSGRDIGPIRILDYYSVVGVPEDQVERVIGAMRNTTVKGRQARVRRYEE